ncbi:hypothetical protein PINS_up003924 [Pythium insidiosum]|nr:hypothetical protein PINS_up003924 [Pythium insidiosum]
MDSRSAALSSASVSVQDSPYAQTHTTSDVINFGLGQPSASLLPLKMIREASLHRLQLDADPAMLQYGAGRGYSGFRGALAEFLSAAYNHPVQAESVMVTAGNSQAISHVAMVLKETGKQIAFVEEPTYFLAFDIFRELGYELVSIPVDQHGIDVNALERLLHSGDTPAMLYTVPFYHNPTGAVLPKDRCERLVQLAKDFNFRIISDEPYNFLSLDGSTHRSLASYDDSGRVISLGSFSKILAPGLRLGWAQSSADTVKALASCGAIRSGGGQNPLTAAIVHSVIEKGHLQPHIDLLKETFARRKLVLCDAIRKMCPSCIFVEPNGGYFVWLRLPEGASASKLFDIAPKGYGVAFTPGSRCSREGKLDNFIRLSFAFYNEDEIKEGVRRLSLALEALQSAAS